MQLWHTNPFDEVRLTRAEGCTVWDAAGKPYLDLLSGTWCSVLGRAHPRWLAAVLAHASTFTHAGSRFVTTAIEEAMAQLSEILPPGLNRAVFLSSGSEAVELALKMARAASGRKAVVVAQRGYYGATMYALALSEAGRTMPYLPALEAVYRLPAPHCGRCPMGRSRPSNGCWSGGARIR